MLAITGFGSRIVQELLPLLPVSEGWCTYDPGADPLGACRYLLCAGYLVGKPISKMTATEWDATLIANLQTPMEIAERILAENPRARIVIMGSESGISGSYDRAYAAAKAAIHNYVETKRLPSPLQQLVAIAPGIIGDAGMTTRRTDVANLEQRRLEHPKGRFCTALEVARLVHFLLYQDEGYISGCVIRMNGGAHTCR